MSVKQSIQTGALPLVDALTLAFEAAANPEIAVGQAAYMKNKFLFLGIQKPTRSLIQRPLFKQHSPEDAEALRQTLLALWNCEYREYHYAACELALLHKKRWTPDFLETFETMIRTHSWWDSVDAIATQLVGYSVQQNADQSRVMDGWINDPDLWIRRTALLHQLKYKEKTDTRRLFQYCVKRMDESDFFIRKAIGWVLREYARTDAGAVIRFVEANAAQMASLSIREALKHFPEERNRLLS